MSAQQHLHIGSEYRSQHVPLDLMVQDWFWWKYQGDPEFHEDYLKPAPDVSGNSAAPCAAPENLSAILICSLPLLPCVMT